MKPLNKKERSKAFYKVVGLFMFSLAIAVILGFVTMKSPDLSENKAAKTADQLKEQNKFQEEIFAPSIEKINQQIKAALEKKKQGEDIEQELSDITASITSIKTEIPEGDDWKNTLYNNLMIAYTDLRAAIDEQVALKEELDDCTKSSSGSGQELSDLKEKNRELDRKVKELQSAAASGDPKAAKELEDAKKEVKKLEVQLGECSTLKNMLEEKVEKLNEKLGIRK